MLQGDLFAPAETPLPAIPGLAFQRDFVGVDEAAALAAAIDAAPLAPFKFQGWTGKRLTASYGSAYDFDRGQVLPAPPLPEWLVDLARRAEAVAGLPAGSIAQALLIRYDPGAALGWHRDRPQYGTVLGLSLGAEVPLRLRRRTASGFERAALPLPSGSLYVLSGEARHGWEHSLAPVPQTRWAITFRTLAG
ncbi:MAG: alpha-ketoglutarate-dependent dioxygenase AlkB [Novosphingobium sp.]|nr:alpha-ketoglutarate-dependent dioxygenase AlkB [Novosphingobium sp.]